MFLERFIYIEVTSNANADPKAKDKDKKPSTRKNSEKINSDKSSEEKSFVTLSKDTDKEEEEKDPKPQVQDTEFAKKIKFKFYFHLFLVFIVHFLVFWYFPLYSNYQKNSVVYCPDPFNTFNCNNFEINTALKFFYIFYLIYFVISALQIKYGSPKSRAGEFVLMKIQNEPANIAFLIYRGIPFLFELRTLMDWTFTATTLRVMQWFKFEEIYANLYNTKCDQLELAEHPRGAKLSFCEKLFKGCCFLFIIMLCILAPLIIFSSLNIIVYDNPVKSLSMSLGIKEGSTNFYPLFTSSMITDKSSVSLHEWNNEDFNKANQLTVNDRGLMKRFTLNTYSDNDWIISKYVSDDLCRALDKKDDLKFLANYVFTRDYPRNQQTVSNHETSSMSDKDCEKFYELACLNTSSSFTKKNTFLKVVRLLSTGSNILPTIINHSDMKTDITVSFTNSTEKVWRVGRNKDFDGIRLYVVSEQYSPVTFNFSVITFYISVVYLVGKLLRVIISGGANNIPLVDMRHPDALMNICSGIYVSRMNGDLKKEEELYYELIDILRSPELMKMIAGSSSIKEKQD